MKSIFFLSLISLASADVGQKCNSFRNCSYGDICCAYAYPSAGGRFVRFCMTQSDIDWNLDPTNGVYSEDKGVT